VEKRVHRVQRVRRGRPDLLDLLVRRVIRGREESADSMAFADHRVIPV